ncbi:putative emopamil-binding protein [Dioscorea sansibarensis]
MNVRHAIASKKAYSYTLQLAICLGQLYGCLVYFITAILEGDNFSTSPFYYWVYYIGTNCWWVLIPSLIAIRSWNKINAAFQSERKTKNL